MEKKLKNQFPVSHAIVEQDQFRALSRSARLLYFYLSKHSNRFADSEGWFFRSVRDLKQDIRIGQKELSEDIDALTNIGLIETRTGKRKITMFRVLDCT